MKNSCYILMGVCGCGKSTIGAMLAERSRGAFLDGDAYHPQANVDKMAAGEPLDDNDRAGWLEAIATAIDTHEGPWPLFFACSALKRKYRDTLRSGERGDGVSVVHLSGTRELLEARMSAREGHFMKARMLDSQFADLEELEADEAGFVADIARAPEEIVMEILD